MFLEGFDEPGVFSVAQGGRIEAEVHVCGADVLHLGFAQQQPGNGATDDRKLAFEAAEDLADLDEHRPDHRCRPVIIVVGGLGLPHNHGKHVAAK